MARLPDYGGLYKGGEDGSGEGALGVRPLGMPLHSKNKVLAGVEFDGFDYVIGRRDGADEQAAAGKFDGLVVRGVDLRFGDTTQAGQPRAGRNAYRVSLGEIVSWTVIDGGCKDLPEYA